jgi:hypothetical protein
VFENRVLRRIFRPKREEMAGDWRRLHNEEIHYLQVSPNIIRVVKSRRMIWAGHVACMGDMRTVYNILVGKSDCMRLLGRPGSRWEDIRMDLLEIGWEGVDWMHLAQDRHQWRAIVNMVMNLRIPYKAGNFLTR